MANRRRIVDRDADTLAAALKSLQARRASPRAWYVLEGPSQPDVYLASDDAVIVVEGKRTETAPATSTHWMSVRHQMLRHLDGAWEHRQGREIYGLFIVEAEQGASVEASSAWQEAVESTVSQPVLNGSLPHRSSDERSQIASALLGVTTWQALCDEFQLPREVLIPEVLDDRPPPGATRKKSGKTLSPAPQLDELDQGEALRTGTSSPPTLEHLRE
jgi:hypothetical protein